MIRVRVRVRPKQVMEELDPDLAEAAAAAVPGVQGVKVWDERVSDALYVTLDINVDEITDSLRSALAGALASLPDMDAFLVVAYGDQVPMIEAAPEDWDAASRVVA